MSSNFPKSGDKPISKKALFDDSESSSSDDDQDDGGATLTPSLKINEEYARRFEHNKKREELHRLQEKYGKNGNDVEESESSSDDESEDDEAMLVTEDLEAEISATLQAIKNKDPRIYDKDAVFYKPFDPEKDLPVAKKEKPMFLRDYHRERYLAGDVGADEDADDNKPKTYAQEQAELKKTIVSEFHAAADAEDEEWSDDDAFLKPVKKQAEEKPVENGIHPSRAAAVKISELDVANADKNPDEFLNKFMASKAWAPPEGSKWQAFESDDGEDDEVDMADEIEHAYNIRFEDPTKSNEILKTYSRNMAASKSVRKEELTGRKRQRQLEKEKKEAEKKEREEERARLRRLKIDEAAEKVAKIKQAAGLSGKAINQKDWAKFLAEDWSDERWEEEMKKRFDDEYYADEDEEFTAPEIAEDEDEDEGKTDSKKKKAKKPTWDDDIDIKDLVPDFEDDEVPAISLTDDEQHAPDAAAEDSDSDSEQPSKKKRKTTKDLKKEKIAAKRQAREQLAQIEAIVDAQMEIDNPRVLASSSKKQTGGFRYRETSPNTFGLTARDILLAPSDAALNEFAGLKKLATFRDEEKKRKDKKKLGKKARLRQWRRENFGREYEHTGPTFGFEKLLEGKEESVARGANAVKPHRERSQKGEDKKEKQAVDGIVEGERKKKRKRSKKAKTAEVEADT
ncbi:hypothetical protein OQA88_10411 [Cercophora sp. LCS_1]